MNVEKIGQSIAYCGLVCALCRSDSECGCKAANQCGKQLPPAGCHQYNCCRERGYARCWACPDFSRGKDMFDEDHLRLRTFVKCIREDSIGAFAEHIARNRKNGIQYHRSGYRGDYDLDTEEAILQLLRSERTDT